MSALDWFGILAGTFALVLGTYAVWRDLTKRDDQ